MPYHHTYAFRGDGVLLTANVAGLEIDVDAATEESVDVLPDRVDSQP